MSVCVLHRVEEETQTDCDAIRTQYEVDCNKISSIP